MNNSNVKVKHSQRMNESSLQTWILANMDGKIDCGHCTCIAGLSETCSHVGAICFAIQKIAESRQAVTSYKCFSLVLLVLLTFLEICN